MVSALIKCPHCLSDKVIKRGKTKNGKQRYYCQNELCDHTSFILDYFYNGCRSEIKLRIIDMGLNGSGVRDTARVLRISPTTVINEFKKKSPLSKR